MRFALLGNHPDGLELTRALVQTGRHELTAYTSPLPPALLELCGARAVRSGDLEEILANPGVDLVVVASSADHRPDHLRRALQSERHVLCVYPPDQSPEVAYEAALIQQDVHRVLLPVVTEDQHPALLRMVRGAGPVGSPQLIALEMGAVGPVLLNTGFPDLKPSFPGWPALRRLGGEIVEVAGLAAGEMIPCDEPILVSGRFEKGGLFRLTFLPGRPQASLRLTVVGTNGRAMLTFSDGWLGPAHLEWQTGDGARHEENWPRHDPWPALVASVEEAIRGGEPAHQAPGSGPGNTPARLAKSPNWDQEGIQTADNVVSALAKTSGATSCCSWQDAIRCLELDDAARRSIQRRHTQLLEFPQASEEIGFKGTMTLVGCATLWGVIMLLILARWWPGAGWLILLLLGGFLLLQLFRLFLPRTPASS
jgi:predicted dehydrogenase